MHSDVGSKVHSRVWLSTDEEEEEEGRSFHRVCACDALGFSTCEHKDIALEASD